MSTGLVLEGGAMRGLYTAGVLDSFLDNNIKIDGIVGVSAGALFGLNFPSKQTGRTIRYNKKYIKDKRYMSLHSLLTTGNLVNRDFAYYELPQKLDVYDEKAFEEANIPFYAAITNIETGLCEYVKIEHVMKQMEVLRATSALPYVSRPVEIDGKLYLDGGLLDSIPVQKCIDLGYDKIIVVLTRTIDYRKTKSSEFMAKLYYKKYPNLVKAINNRYNVYNSTVEKIIDLELKKEIFVIRPSVDLKIKRIERNIDKLDQMYNLGISDCKNCLEELKAYIEN